MGSEERQELEAKIDDLEERVDECEKTQKDVFLTICQVCPINDDELHILVHVRMVVSSDHP